MTRIVRAAASYFVLVFGAEFALGLIRVPFLVPRIGERHAELVEMPFMFVAILFAARFIVRRFLPDPMPARRLAAGVGALVLMLTAEASLVIVLQGRPLTEYVATRDPVSGTAYLAMLAVFALMPALISPSGDPSA